jgi:hypothetical protein
MRLRPASSSLEAGAFNINHWSSVAVTAPIAPGEWKHVAGTYDGAKLKLYMDGVTGRRDRLQPADRPFHRRADDRGSNLSTIRGAAHR